MQTRMKRPSPAMGVAMVALALSVGGGDAVAQDAYTAAKKLITGKNIKKNSIGADRLTAAARRQLKGNLGPAGPTGPIGPTGPAGPAGSPDTSKFYDKDASDTRFLGLTAKAADSDKLDGFDSSAFLGAGAKAADADLLDGLDSTAFLGASAKAADAETVDGVDSADLARIGTTLISSPPHDWLAFQPSDPLTLTRFSDTMRYSRTATGGSFLIHQVELPNTIGGKRQKIVSVRFCANASATASISSVSATVFRFTAGAGATVATATATGTPFTDAACRQVTFAGGGFELASGDAFGITLFANWSVANSSLDLGAVTVALAPTTTDGPLAARGADPQGTDPGPASSRSR